MLIRPIDCVVGYVTGLNASLKRISSASLTKSQSRWLVTVLMGLVVAGSFNWAAFSRRSLGAFKESRLRWIFRHANIAWSYLLQASIANVLAHYGVREGALVLDDSDKVRCYASRNTEPVVRSSLASPPVTICPP